MTAMPCAKFSKNKRASILFHHNCITAGNGGVPQFTGHGVLQSFTCFVESVTIKQSLILEARSFEYSWKYINSIKDNLVIKNIL